MSTPTRRPLPGGAVAELLGVPFSAEQLAVITAPADRPLQIVAGAGSGKTAVMAARVVWLVGSGFVRPAEVLGLTFTAKAAGELGARIRGALDLLPRAASPGDHVADDAADDAADDEPTVATYHGYAASLVREHGLLVGVEPDARVLADATRFQLAGSVLRRYGGPLPGLSRQPGEVLAGLVSLESECSDHLADPTEVRAVALELAAQLDAEALAWRDVPRSKTRSDALTGCATAARARADLCLLVAAYREAKRRGDVVDFGDQIVTAVRIARGAPQVAAAERLRYRAVLLDEYQDTSVAQRMLLVALFGAGHPVVAVGDPFQAIYGWRGASVDNLVRFPRHFAAADGAPAPVASMTVSQRSGERILQAANALAVPLRAAHPVEPLLPRADRTGHGRLLVARHPTWADELAGLCAALRAELDAGTPPAQIAVLLRTWSAAGPVHAALTAAGIPVEVVGLGGLLTLPEVADTVAVLELVDDATASAALVRLLTGPRWQLDPRDLRALGQQAARLAGPTGGGEVERDPLDEAAAGVDPADLVALADALDRPGDQLSAEGARRVEALGTELRELRRRAGDPLLDLVGRVLAVTGLDVEVAATPAAVGARRRESLARFLDVVAGYVGLDGTADLRGFLAYLRAAEEYDRGFDSALPSDGDAVQLMTVHKAKGLEWDVVALPNLTAGVFPSTQSRGRWPTRYDVLPHRHRHDQASLAADPDFTAKSGLKDFEAESKRLQRLEEDRLAYVAVTRARRLVIASNAVWGPTQKTVRPASPYLETLREQAEQGAGEVVCWAPEPAEGETNPALAPGEFVYPPPQDAAQAGARREAADRVLAGLADPVAAVAAADADLTPAERDRFAALDAEADALLAEAAAAHVGVLAVPLPAALTASQVLTLRREPDVLAAQLARPLPRRPSPAAARGTAFHAWVEQLFGLTPLLEPEELPGAVDDAPRDATLGALQEAFRAAGFADVAPHAVEAPFSFVVGGHVLRGRIDAVYDLDKSGPLPGDEPPPGVRWHVVDWKTGREPADPWQLAVYRLAWARLAGCPPEAVRASFLVVPTGRLDTPADLAGEAGLATLLTGSG